jgi:hypothetical protein
MAAKLETASVASLRTRGALVAMEAMGTQTEIACAIRDAAVIIARREE